ncbi:MAG: DUF169 domain-containing protein [Deltaproteobacteria bacterium]|nr:DUF169 domain-containing protein [Deltaproteobacteria bacterium]
MSWRSECEQLDRALKQRLFISNAPVAVRLVSPAEEAQAPAWLEKIRKPGKGLPEKVLVCQAMAMVRLYGWQVLVTPESVECPTGLLTMGWVDMSPEYLRGEIPVSPFNQSDEARGRRMEAVTCMPSGSVAAMAAAPLGDCPFEPQAVVIYCTPGQAMRLVQSTLFEEGGVVESSSAGAQGCSQYLSRVILSGKPRYILPGNGDRIFGHVEDHQMAFSLPMSYAGRLAEGIEKSHLGGQAYPVPGYLRAEFQVPKAYAKASAHLRQFTKDKTE